MGYESQHRPEFTQKRLAPMPDLRVDWRRTADTSAFRSRLWKAATWMLVADLLGLGVLLAVLLCYLIWTVVTSWTF